MGLAVNNIPAVSARLDLPRYGQWVCEAQLDDPGDGSFERMLAEGIATLAIDTTAFAASDAVVGRIVAQQSQTFGLRASVVFTAGRGAHLYEEIGERAYHDDSGVKVATVLDDVLKDTGHTRLGDALARTGTHFVRELGPASRALTALLGKVWTFDLAGLFRPQLSNQRFPEFDLLHYDAANQRCTLALNNLVDPRGCMIAELGRSVESACVTIDGEGIRAECCLSELTLPTIIESIVEAVIARKVMAPQYYRVHSMASGGRVNLQPFDTGAGLPDLINTPQYPGIAGAVVTLNAGQVVLVQFVGNDRTKPIITQHVSEGDEHVSASIVINGSDAVAARVGDDVRVGPFTGQMITLGAPGSSGVAPLGVPIPFQFGLAEGAPSPSGLDISKLNGSITSSSSTVRL